MIKIKPGASIDGCRVEIVLALIRVAPVFGKQGVDTVVTSGSEPYKHNAERSGHYRGDAIDLRAKHIAADKRRRVHQALRRKLGSDFVVLHEGKGKPWEHFHIHWSPTYHSGA